MARIPLAEIPNAPQLPGAPPVANYPAVPATRLQAQPYVQGRVKPMQTIANFEKYAADLQQAPLPGGFAEGAAMTSAAAGRYASFAGEATEEIGRSISNALNSIGSVISDAANKANASKDAVDLIRYSYLEDQAKMAADADMEKRNIPVEQRPEMWQKEYAPRFMASAQNLGTTPATRAKIQAHAAGFVESQYLGYTTNVFKKTHQDNIDFLGASYEEAAKKGDAAGMRTAAYELRAQNYENEGKLKLRLAEADRVQHQETIDFVRQRNPQELRDQAVAARDGKATGEFKFLNEDPSLANHTAVEAAQELNTRQTEKITDFSNRILSRDKRMTDEQIESEGRAAGLDETDIAKLKKQNVLEVPWNDQKVAEANMAVATFDPRDDIDPKTGLPSVTRYKEIVDQINTTVPKEYRQPFLSDLNKAMREARSGEKKNPMEKRRGDYLQDLDRLAKSELLGPTGLSKKAGEKDKIIDVKAHAELFKKVTTIQNGIDDLLEKAQAEKWPMTKFDEEYRKLLVPFMSKEAGEAIYKKGVPELPPVSATEEKARAAPVAQIAGRPPINPALQQGEAGQRFAQAAAGNLLGGRLTGKGPAFQAAAEKHGIDSALLVAIAAHETGRGTSTILAERNNPGGLYDSKNKEYYRFASVDEGIDAMARNLKENYIDKGLTTIEEIQKEYAPVGENDPKGLNKDWAPGVRGFYEKIKGASQQKLDSVTELKNVNPTLVAKLDTLQQKFGKLNITSGYRSPEHNLAVGGARGSQHTHGNAVDISVKGMSVAERLALIDAATRAGITGIGVYANALHFDVGPRRAWGPSHGRESVPKWAEQAIGRHLGYG